LIELQYCNQVKQFGQARLVVGNSDDEEVRRGKTQEMLVEMGLRREVGAKGMFALVKCCRDDYVDVKIEVAREEGGECENDGEGELGFTGEAEGVRR
jgi:hypothetical protein